MGDIKQLTIVYIEIHTWKKVGKTVVSVSFS